MNRIKVMIVDDHVLVREGLRQLLGTQNDIEVVGEAGDGVEALEMARRLQPDVLLLDIAMPRMNGLEAMRLLRTAAPETRVVVLSMYEKEAYVQEMQRAGAFGYVLKCEPSADMLAAVRAAFARRYFFSKRVHQEAGRDQVAGRCTAARAKTFDALSAREKQVFFLVIEGNPTTQIGEVLCVSPKTIEKHRTAIAKKLGVKTPVEMIRYAIRWDLVDVDFWQS